jgi:DNA polymerase III delta prime subunit
LVVLRDSVYLICGTAGDGEEHIEDVSAVGMFGNVVRQFDYLVRAHKDWRVLLLIKVDVLGQVHIVRQHVDLNNFATWGPEEKEIETAPDTKQGEIMTTATETTVETKLPLHLKYRPQELDTVIGHVPVLKALKKAIEDPNRSHAFCFVGHTGVGKTTLARIMAKAFGANQASIQEFDAGSSGGVDNIRDLISNMRQLPLTGNAKVIILDECHVLTTQAFNALLKSVEEAPSFVYWFFLTTHEAKIPDNIKSRVSIFRLDPVPTSLIQEYITGIAEIENMRVPDGTFDLIARASTGSVRKALVELDKVQTCQTLEQVRQFLDEPDESENNALIMIAKAMMAGKSNWDDYKGLVQKIDKPGGSKLQLKSYLAKCAQYDSNWQKFALILSLVDKMEQYPSGEDARADLLLVIYAFIQTMSKSKQQ